MPAPQPRMHGLTHVPGGSDPIPGLTTAGPAATFFDAVIDLAATSDLRGYWRLGEGGFGPYADLKPASSWANVPMARVDQTVDMTDIDPGALPAGQDDGAVQFNSPTGLTADHLEGTNTWGSSAANPFESGWTELTVAGWVKPIASTSTFDGGVFSYLNNPGTLVGYALGVTWPARTVFWRGAARLVGPVLTADEWVFVCGVHDATSDRLYVNGALVATGAITVGATGNSTPKIGGVWTNTSTFNQLYGAVDEVSVWADALTADQIAGLYTAGAGDTSGLTPGSDYATPAQLQAKVDRDAVETATARLVAVKLAAGDTQPAFKIRGDGRIEWGPGGTTAADTSLYRDVATILRTAGHFKSGGQVFAYESDAKQVVLGSDGTGPAAGIAFGSAADARLYRSASATLKTDGDLHIVGLLYVDTANPGTTLFSNLVLNFKDLGLRLAGVGPADSGGAGYRTVRVTN